MQLGGVATIVTPRVYGCRGARYLSVHRLCIESRRARAQERKIEVKKDENTRGKKTRGMEYIEEWERGRERGGRVRRASEKR